MKTNNKKYGRRNTNKVKSAIASDLALMYKVATWRERRDAELDELRAENIMLRRQVKLAGEFIEGSDKQYDRLLADVTGRTATMKPPIPKGITRVKIFNITEIVDESNTR